MAKRKIFIYPNGNLRALCDNKIENNPKYGTKTIKRAADVEFNNESQVWEILTPEGEVIGSHARRADAIALEIKLVEERIRSEWIKTQSLTS